MQKTQAGSSNLPGDAVPPLGLVTLLGEELSGVITHLGDSGGGEGVVDTRLPKSGLRISSMLKFVIFLQGPSGCSISDIPASLLISSPTTIVRYYSGIVVQKLRRRNVYGEVRRTPFHIAVVHYEGGA